MVVLFFEWAIFFERAIYFLKIKKKFAPSKNFETIKKILSHQKISTSSKNFNPNQKISALIKKFCCLFDHYLILSASAGIHFSNPQRTHFTPSSSAPHFIRSNAAKILTSPFGSNSSFFSVFTS